MSYLYVIQLYEGGGIKDHVKKSIRSILHTIIGVHSRRLISQFLEHGVKCISKIQSHCKNMTFSGKIIYDRIFQLVSHKGGESSINYINKFQNTQD